MLSGEADRGNSPIHPPRKRKQGEDCDPRKRIICPNISRAGHLCVATSGPWSLEGGVELQPECVASGLGGQHTSAPLSPPPTQGCGHFKLPLIVFLIGF